jgi:Na+/H+ antiporter NhaD/arsenite permease-like protein
MHAAQGSVVFGWSALAVASVLFVGTYAMIMTERLNRAIVALLGAGLMILSGILNQAAAVRGVDFNTLGLLTGMMVIVAVTRKTGVFQYVAIWSAKKVKARPWGILLMLATVTALFSALLDNVTTVLLIVPVTLLITEELEVKPYPYLFAIIFASNIGGTATLIGDPPNIMIGSATGLTFNDFILNLAPLAAVVYVVTMVPVYLIWRREFYAGEEARQRVLNFNAREAITDPRLLKQSLLVLSGVIAGFVFAHPLHLQPATIAMFGAAMLLMLQNLPLRAEEQSGNVHASFAEVEWVTIFFFVGLFILVHGIEQAGLIQLMAGKLVAATRGDMGTTSMAVLWGSAVLSAMVDNIPFVATMIPLIKSMAPDLGGAHQLLPLWWSLSLGACLGGNGSLIGASANLVVAGFAERAGHPIRFAPFLVVAFPLMLLSIALSSGYVYLRYL